MDIRIIKYIEYWYIRYIKIIKDVNIIDRNDKIIVWDDKIICR